MNDWEWVLLAGGGYLAVISLVRLMRRRRESILDEIRRQVDVESRRQQREQLREERRKRQDQATGKAA